MKLLRSAPFSPLVVASALQVFIFSCWLLPVAAAGAAVVPDVPAAVRSDRQLFMNVLRSAPFSPFAFASALQVVILCCWLFSCEAWAMACPATTASAAPIATNHLVRLIPTPFANRLRKTPYRNTHAGGESQFGEG